MMIFSGFAIPGIVSCRSTFLDPRPTRLSVRSALEA